MSIRVSVSVCIFLVVILFIAATGWLARQGMGRFQDGISRHFHAELLEQGSTDFAASATQFFQLFENLPVQMRTGDPVADLAPFLVEREGRKYFFFNGKGEALRQDPSDNAFPSLLSGPVLQDFFEKAQTEGTVDMAVDNYRAYLEGNGAVPVTIQLRAYPGENLILGMGRTQDLAGIRLQSLAEIGAELVASTAQRGIGFFALLAVFTLFLVWLCLHFALLQPLVRVFARSGTGSLQTGLTWSELHDYADRLRVTLDEKEAIRSKLEGETENRFQAEEERDRVQNQLDNALHKFEEDIRRRYTAQLLEAQTELMHREARAIHRHIAEPLERAHKAAVSASVDAPLQSALDECLNTVHGLIDRERDLPHAPSVLALQPWLQELVARFGSDHEVQIQANIQNSASVHVDAGNLGKALESVLENALQASTEAREITVDTARVDDAVEIRIVDRGTGIDGDARPHILVPFFSLREGRDGLGLSVARAVIRQHGGHLRFRSESEKGTAAIITLPLAKT